MYMVYWALTEDGGALPQSRAFASEEMSAALQFMEGLRAQQRDGGPVAFITMCAENPQSVGPAGVADPSPDYNWKKRRR